MPDLASSRPHSDPRPGHLRGSESPTSRWAVWAVFAASMMILVGSLQAMQGLVAIFDDDYYRVPSSGLVLDLGDTAWGWTHLLLGVLIVVSGLGVLSGNVAARAVGVALAALSILVNIVYLPALPLWGVVAITVDVLVIYALTVHGGELRGH
ncbi:hypothetical protein [Blastococcus sp. URHD0036]|uniref:DUF7144 family membrane protein n=1 Tax=Blastococcus sp. URHD0036 TaxID=1380356 RepID=UPI000496FB93|nr:hypothetical protein [Blastococcus sp. URHD0036]